MHCFIEQLPHLVIKAMPCSYLQKTIQYTTVVIYTSKCLSTARSSPGGLPPQDQCLVFRKFFSRPIENVIKLFFINGKKAK
jgi:hypothetical protein